jgi:hypothetical protein
MQISFVELSALDKSGNLLSVELGIEERVTNGLENYHPAFSSESQRVALS